MLVFEKSLLPDFFFLNQVKIAWQFSVEYDTFRTLQDKLQKFLNRS